MILVTGATGFLGSEVVRQLEKSNTVRALKRDSSTIPEIIQNAAVEWKNADLLNYFDLEEAFEGIKQVYHCAAIVSFKPSEKKKMIRNNIEGTANIVNICLDKNIRLVHVSSVAAIGKGKNGLTSEKDHWQYSSRETGYAISKYESEMEVWRGISEGLNAIIVNPSIIIGKNGAYSMGDRFFVLAKKELKFYSSGSQGFVDVEDVAKNMIVLMNSEIAGERFIVTAENWTYTDLFKEIALQFGLKPPTLEAKPWMLNLGVVITRALSVFTGKNYGLTADTARSAFNKSAYNNRKIKDATGLEFKLIKQTIAEVCQNQEK
ncbi:MAG TPA: NAD-dependent epimerase/dehydratase family protein [Sphingobacteriaceae bacterium]|nr:NAD-dependent epimerase/dehydratase family protein [Sphingobacteriaceae bacterium]